MSRNRRITVVKLSKRAAALQDRIDELSTEIAYKESGLNNLRNRSQHTDVTRYMMGRISEQLDAMNAEKESLQCALDSLEGAWMQFV